MHDFNLDILLFSHDPHLVHSRDLLLQKAGYNVASVDTVSSFQSTLAQRSAKIILLCQTLSPEECQSCEQFAKERNPDVQVLVLFNQRCKCVPGVGGILLRSASGPIMLLDTVRDMLHRYPAVQHSAAA